MDSSKGGIIIKDNGANNSSWSAAKQVSSFRSSSGPIPFFDKHLKKKKDFRQDPGTLVVGSLLHPLYDFTYRSPFNDLVQSPKQLTLFPPTIDKEGR